MKKDTITFCLDQKRKKGLDAIAYILNEAGDEFIEFHQWQFAHIQKGIEQADREQFASEEEIQTAFERGQSEQ